MTAQDRRLTEQMLAAADRGDWFAVLDIREQLMPSQRQYSRPSGTPVATARTATPAAPTPARSREQVETDYRKLIAQQLVEDSERLSGYIAATPMGRRESSWHEAGHATVACLLFGPRAVKYLEVHADGNPVYAGSIVLNISMDEQRQRPFDTLTFLAAGQVAECIHKAMHGGRIGDLHDGIDLQDAGRLLGRTVRRDDPEWDAATTRSWKLLQARLPLLRDMANAGFDAGRLECAGVARIMGSYPL